MSQCEKCGFKHGQGPCCIDVFQQLSHQKGPPILGQILLAFVLPAMVFMGSLGLANYILSDFMNKGGLRTFLVFAAAIVTTLIFVQLIRIFTRKPISPDKTNK
jgi:hypothetical protein